MFIPSSSGAALAVALVSTVCWGSWSNFLKFTGDRMRFELFYLNFSISVFLTAIVGALTLGVVKTGGDKGDVTFFDDFKGIGMDRYLDALLAGFIFNVANLLLCKGIVMLGLALAFPLCIGTAMVLGTLLTYSVDHKGDPALLFSGVFVAFTAVCLAAFMHRLKEGQQQKAREIATELMEGGGDVEVGSGPETEASMTRKLLICIAGGVLMSCWNYFTTLAESDPGLTPFGEFFFYTLAVFLSSLLVVPLMILYPVEGTRGEAVGLVLAQYPKAPGVCQVYGLLSGVVWACGTMANAVAGASPSMSPAESYAIGQCANVTAILWGVFLFQEFKGTDTKVKGLAVLVVVLYICAIGLVAAAS